MALTVNQRSTTVTNDPAGVEIATVIGAYEAVTATLDSDQLTGSTLEVIYSAEDLAALAATADGFQTVAVLVRNAIIFGDPYTAAQIDGLTQQIRDLSANVVGHVIYHPGTITTNATDALTFTVNAPGSAATYLPVDPINLFPGVVSPTGQVNPPATVTVNESILLDAGPIVTLVPAIATNTAAGVEIATVTGTFEAVTATLTGDQLAGGSLEVVYSAEDLAALAATADGFQNVAIIIQNNFNDGTPLSAVQITALTQQIRDLAANVVGHVIYHPGTITTNATDALSFTISTPGSTAVYPTVDPFFASFGYALPTGPIDPPVSVTVNESILLNPGPIADTVVATVNLGQTIDLTAAILAKVTPGLPGDTEIVTAFSLTSAGGLVALTNGHLTYGAQSNAALAHIVANGSVTDNFTYTVTDQFHNTATGSVNVTVNNPAVVIEGPLKGKATIQGGSQTNIVNAHGAGNTIIESGGNDVVNAGTGSATVTTGSGDVVVNLNGTNNKVIGGNGNDTINLLTGGKDTITLGTGTDRIVESPTSTGSNTFILNGSHASLVLYGSGDVAFINGGTTSIADHSQGLKVKVGVLGGVIDLNGFAADRSGIVDLLGGVGGYKTAKSVVAALHSDGHGGTLLSLGAAGQIDFVDTLASALTAAHFKIG